MLADRLAHLYADPLAVDLRNQGFSLEVIDRVIERAAILEHDGGMADQPVAVLIAAACEVDAVPAERRMHRAPVARAAGIAA